MREQIGDAAERLRGALVPSPFLRLTTSKVWLVTGSSRGLGRDPVNALVAQGYRVAATAGNPADVADLVAPSGGRAIALRLDGGGVRARRRLSLARKPVFNLS